MKGREIRQSFLDFFAERGHRLVPSAPFVPQSDPTLLFTNAGMVPFKNFFLGLETPPGPRATSSQKCLRVSGKHNDLENVGPSHRHHTFFEMLGNFSFGDYFQAGCHRVCVGAGRQGLGATSRACSTPPSTKRTTRRPSCGRRSRRCPPSASFAAARRTTSGRWATPARAVPARSCTSIGSPELPAVSWGEGSESGRYFEFWNLVFMQFDCDESGQLHPLPNPSIDTGAGLERVASVLQRVASNYETDLFRPLLDHAADVADVAYGRDETSSVSLRVIADHVRAVGFLLADGVIPSNEGRGYVLRRILRRGVRHGLRLGLEEPFLHQLLPTLAETMDSYGELAATRDASAATVLAEEQQFLSTVAAGAGHVQAAVDRARAEGRDRLSGEEAFRLYDTYGLPVEMIREILEEEALTVDEDGFEAALTEQRERSRSATSRSQGEKAGLRRALFDGGEIAGTEFAGYDQLASTDARTLRVVRETDGGFAAVDALEAGERGVVVVDQTVFYAESGGQVGDIGSLSGAAGRCRRGRHPEGGRSLSPLGRGHRGTVGGRRARLAAGRRAAPTTDRAQPHGHPSPPCGAAESARYPGSSGGLSRAPQSPAL